MNSEIKEKTIRGMAWSFVDNLSNQGLNFVIGIILARILSPEEFGTFGILMIFIAISTLFVDGGVSQALIRKADCNDKDYNTAFVFNITIGLLFYLLTFFLSPYIALFFENKALTDLLRVLGLVIIINSFGVIQYTILSKRIAFNIQTKISIISSIVGGGVGIYMALSGYGIWSLIGKQIGFQVTQTIFLFLYIHWIPRFYFNKESFAYLFGFGSKLLISGFIDVLYKNITYIVIGKFFSPSSLGFYSRAEQYSNIVSNNITTTTQRVSYPVLANLNEDEARLKAGYIKITKNVMFLTFIVMFGIAACAEPLILALIGDKWSSSIIMLQLLCFSQMFYPYHSLNLNLLNVKGRSDLFLKLEIIKKILMVPFVAVGIFYGINLMLIGFIIYSILCIFINSYYTNKLIDYSVINQLKDISSSFFIGLILFVCLYLLSRVLPFSSLINLLLLMLIGGGIVLVIGELFKISEYVEIKKILLKQVKHGKE